MSESPQVCLPGIQQQRGDVSSDSCFTPLDIIEGATACLGGRIDTDPFWHPDSFVPDEGTRYDGRERGDGETMPYHGSLWMNPKYSDPQPACVRFAIHADEGHKCIALVKLDPTTEAWRTLTADGRVSIGLLRRRVKFKGAYAGGKAPNMVVAFVARNIGPRKLAKHLPMADWLYR